MTSEHTRSGQGYERRYRARKARQQLQRVPSLGPLRHWLPAVVGLVGAACGVISLRGLYQTNAHTMALTAPRHVRALPAVALNVGSLALILLGSRLHGHWFIRITRHSPAQSIMIAGELSCQPLWINAQQEQEGGTLGEPVSAMPY